MSELVNGVSSTGRTKVTLGDIATNVSENEYKPKDKGLDRCVGLEHLDPGSLKIRRWSPITPEMSFTRRFSKGQILFGKRRAYQKKVALADFDGICSSDILVIEAKKENFVPELLPFIVQDDRFFEYAIDTSSGSLSPRTKWKFLAEYEFWLPSLDDQHRFINMLRAAEDCIMKGERFLAITERAKQVLMRELFNKGIGNTEFKEVKGFGKVPKGWEIGKLKTISDIRYGVGQPPELDPSGIPMIRATDIKRGIIVTDEIIRVNVNAVPNSRNPYLKFGDIIVVRSGAYTGDLAIYKNQIKNAIAGYDLIVSPKKDHIDSFFLSIFMLDSFVQRYFKSQSARSAQPHINSEQLGNTPIPLPPLPEQRQIAAILTRCDETIAAARANVSAIKALKMKLIKEMFSRG